MFDFSSISSIYTGSGLYRGFVITRGKQSLQKFGDGAALASLNEVFGCQSFGGVLAEDTVLIDFDDTAQAQAALNVIKNELDNVLVIKTTRGIHALFRNNGRIKQCYTHVNLACGLLADIKIGAKHSYEILKLDGNLREILNPIDTEREIPTVPAFFLPCKSLQDSLFGLSDGEGRNDRLFRALSALKKAGLSADEIRESVDITNRYVFADEISQTELEQTVLRPEVLNAPVSAGRPKAVREKVNPAVEKALAFYGEKAAPYIDDWGQLRVEDLAEQLIEDFHFCVIDNVVQAYHERRRCYVSDVEIHKAMISTYVRNLSAQKMTSIYAHICQKVRENIDAEKKHSESRYIPFDNGILDSVSGNVLPYSADFVFVRKIPHAYRADAYDATGDKFLDEITCGDKTLRSLLEEMMGYCLLRDSRYRKAFILTGEKRNGKSTYLTMLQYMLGIDNLATMDMDAFSERFAAAELYGRLANIGDDINDEFLGNTAILKKLVSGEMIQAERKGRDPFRFVPYAKQIFSANDTPKMRDKTGAMLDRIVFVPFNAYFPAEKADVTLIDKLKAESNLEYMLRLAVEGLHRLLERGYFLTPEPSQVESKKYEIYNSPVAEWFEEISWADINGQKVADVYAKYKTFALESGLNAVSRRNLCAEIRRKFGMETETRRFGLEVARVFVAKQEATEQAKDAPQTGDELANLFVQWLLSTGVGVHSMTEVREWLEIWYDRRTDVHSFPLDEITDKSLKLALSKYNVKFLKPWE